MIAHLPPMRRAGRTLLWCVSGFGLATIVFGLSQWFWLSLAMLFLTGVFDSVSVVVRHTVVQLLTPDEMRGRVSALNNIFIGTSNEFGAVESGLTAAAFGAVVSPSAGESGRFWSCWPWHGSGRKRARSARSTRTSPSEPSRGF
jgi:MFS family permease